MQIRLASIFVEDQEKALKFYTEILGFVKKEDIPMGDFRWLTVVSPDSPGDIELVLEPNENPAANTFQQAIFKQGIPATAFFVEDMDHEYKRLTQQGVKFTAPPTSIPQGPTIALFEDTCGNLIQLVQT